MRFVGIDVGVAAMHCVVLDGSCHMSAAQALPSDAATELKDRPTTRPPSPSTLPPRLPGDQQRG